MMAKYLPCMYILVDVPHDLVVKLTVIDRPSVVLVGLGIFAIVDDVLI
jgi:hypothetical protein